MEIVIVFLVVGLIAWGVHCASSNRSFWPWKGSNKPATPTTPSTPNPGTPSTPTPGNPSPGTPTKPIEPSPYQPEVQLEVFSDKVELVSTASVEEAPKPKRTRKAAPKK